MGLSFKKGISIGAVTMLLSLAVAIALSGCGGNAPQSTSPAATGNDNAAGFSIPAPLDIHATSDTVNSLFRLGDEHRADLPNSLVSASSHNLKFRPEKNEETGEITPAYALYTIDGLVADEYNATVIVAVTEYETDNIWIGFANYQRNCWQWRELRATYYSNRWNEFDPAINVNDEKMLIAIVAMNDVDVKWLAVGGATPPIPFDIQPRLVMTGDEVQFITEVPNTPIETYNWDFGGGATPNTSEEPSPIVTAAAPGIYYGELTASNVLGACPTSFIYLVTEVTDVPPQHLLAIPEETVIHVDEPVLVTVKCGDFPQQQPMHNVFFDLLIPESADYVSNSFNVGAPGGAKTELDGIWATFDDPVPGWFDVPDALIYFGSSSIPGMKRAALCGTPLGDSLTTTGGDIVNMQFTFSQPGEYEMGFLPWEDGGDTYYTNCELEEFLFYDASNDDAPSITVIE